MIWSFIMKQFICLGWQHIQQIGIEQWKQVNATKRWHEILHEINQKKIICDVYKYLGHIRGTTKGGSHLPCFRTYIMGTLQNLTNDVRDRICLAAL